MAVAKRIAQLPKGIPPGSKNGDWAWAQAEYETGATSTIQIAKALGVTDAAVVLRAQRHAWVRDPLARAKIIAQVQANDAAAFKLDQEKRQAEIIAVTAAMQSQVLVSHRKDIQVARSLVSALLVECLQATTDITVLHDLAEVMYAPDERGRDRLNAAYRRVISLPERTTAINTLATALKTLILLERQAYGISGLIEDPDAVRAPAEVTRGLSDIMAKFDAVLALQAPTASGPEAPLPVVEDISVPRPTTPATA